MKLVPDLGGGARHAARKPRSRATAGGLLLWAGTTSIGASTVLILAVLSRHHHEGFSGLSTLFSLFFIASLIPAGVPLRAAALAADGAQPPWMTARHLGALVLGGIVVSPLVASVLHLPVPAVGFVSAQVIVAIQLAIRRGPLIAARRFSALGGNLFLEAATRVVLCTAAGLLCGLTGLSAGLLAGTAAAWVTMPGRSPATEVTQRPMTTMFHTWIALALLGLLSSSTSSSPRAGSPRRPPPDTTWPRCPPRASIWSSAPRVPSSSPMSGSGPRGKPSSRRPWPR